MVKAGSTAQERMAMGTVADEQTLREFARYCALLFGDISIPMHSSASCIL